MTLLAEKLKEHTAEAHEKMHGHPALSQLLDVRLSFEYYQNVVTKFYAFHKGMEEAIDRSGKRDLYEAHRTDTLPLLQNDLSLMASEAATCTASVAATATAEHATAVDFSTPEAIWGYLYVKEGSALGGTVIHKALKSSLPDYSDAFLYFKGAGKSTAERWGAFVQCLNTETLTLNHELICQSANEVFKELYTWMD